MGLTGDLGGTGEDRLDVRSSTACHPWQWWLQIASVQVGLQHLDPALCSACMNGTAFKFTRGPPGFPTPSP